MVKKYLNKLIKNQSIKNILTLFGGYLLAQLIMFASMPLLSRIYSKEIFGIFFVYIAIVSILSIISTLQYDLAIVLPKDDEDAINVLILNVAIVFVISLLILLFIIVFFNYINDILGKKQIGNWLYFIPLSVFLMGLFQTFNSWNNRLKQYSTISKANIFKSITNSGIQISTGYGGFTNSGLFIGIISGQFIASLFLLIKIIISTKKYSKIININRIILLAKHYKDLPIFNTIISLTNKTSVQMPVILLSSLFGSASAGLYGMADRIISIPFGMVNQSIAKVFYQTATEKFNNNSNFFAHIKNTYIKLFLIAIIPYSLIFILAPKFSILFLGEQWKDTGYYIQALIPWLFLAFINSPISSIITILNKQRFMVIYNFLLLIGRVSALYIGHKYFNNGLYSIILFSTVGIIFNLFLMFYFLHIAKKYGIKKDFI